MLKSEIDRDTHPQAAFWTSKLGQAALASIAAMFAMIVVTTQTGDAGTVTFAAPHADRMIVEIA